MKNNINKIFDFTALRYTIFSVINKSIVALTQIFSIYVFTNLFSQSEVTILFLLLGYVIWFQIFELGLSQTLQNKFNLKLISNSDFFSICILHLGIIILISCVFFFNSFYEKFLIPSNEFFSIELIKSFTLGASLLIVSSNNLILQRLLLVLNKDIIINSFQFFQTILSLFGLLICNYLKINDVNIMIFVYFFPIVLTNIINLFYVKFFLKFHFTWKISFRKIGFFTNTLNFWLIGILSSLYIGMDYYFAAHFLENADINAYHIYSRIFFISFLFYYAYIQYSSKNISQMSIEKEIKEIKKIVKVSSYIGFTGVTFMFFITLLFDYVGLIDLITNGIEVNLVTLISAFIYYLVRVFRDVILVIMKCINQINQLLKVHLVEIVLALILLNYLIPKYGIKGIFISFTLSSFVGLIYLFLFNRRFNL
jgi:O-antigen/teichoic acid export membrane protein